MHALLAVLGFLASFSDAGPDAGPDAGRWAAHVAACVQADLDVWTVDREAGLAAFACGKGDRRLVVMANASDAPRRVPRTGGTPLVPVYVTGGDEAAVPSLLITLFEAGGVVYSNEVPARTAVVFRPADYADVRPRGLDE